MPRTDLRSQPTLPAVWVALLLFFLMQPPMLRLAGLDPLVHPDLLDALRGLCLGIAIAALAVTARRKRRAA